MVKVEPKRASERKSDDSTEQPDISKTEEPSLVTEQEPVFVDETTAGGVSASIVAMIKVERTGTSAKRLLSKVVLESLNCARKLYGPMTQLKLCPVESVRANPDHDEALRLYVDDERVYFADIRSRGWRTTRSSRCRQNKCKKVSYAQ